MLSLKPLCWVAMRTLRLQLIRSPISTLSTGRKAQPPKAIHTKIKNQRAITHKPFFFSSNTMTGGAVSNLPQIPLNLAGKAVEKPDLERLMENVHPVVFNGTNSRRMRRK
jgi:hypothetical protein